MGYPYPPRQFGRPTGYGAPVKTPNAVAHMRTYVFTLLFILAIFLLIGISLLIDITMVEGGRPPDW
jgi:hypothetical protein